MKAAVYMIHTADFSHYYIGSTNNTAVRFKHHRTSLRSGKHANLRLQRTFNKYGEDALIFSVAEAYADRASANAAEADLLAFHHSKPGCMNFSSLAMALYCPHVVARRVQSLQSPRHRSAASAAAIQFASDNPERAAAGHAASALTRSAINWRMQSSSWMKAVSAIEPAKSVFVKRIRDWYDGGGVNAMSRKVVMIEADGVETEFESAQAAARKTGANNSAIGMVCSGKRRLAGGCAWRFA